MIKSKKEVVKNNTPEVEWSWDDVEEAYNKTFDDLNTTANELNEFTIDLIAKGIKDPDLKINVSAINYIQTLTDNVHIATTAITEMYKMHKGRTGKFTNDTEKELGELLERRYIDNLNFFNKTSGELFTKLKNII